MQKGNLKSVIEGGIAGLHPGYFALVMATGIVSIASLLMEMKSIAWVLFRINQVSYIVLWLLTLVRLFRYFPRLKSEITGHSLGPGFFTVVATQSISVLGTLIAFRFVTLQEEFLFFTLIMYLLGSMHYILIISLIFYRFIFFKLDPKYLTPHPIGSIWVQSPSPPWACLLYCAS